jgi:hypothetical protein
MIYNPIFEEETDKQTRQSELKQLKKAIVKRNRKQNIQKTLNRVYGILKRTPISSLLNTTEKDLLQTK